MAKGSSPDADVKAGAGGQSHPTKVQKDYLRRGLEQPGGKLPLFDTQGRAIGAKTVRACIAHGWAAPWFANPLKQDWLVCRLTKNGRKLFDDQK